MAKELSAQDQADIEEARQAYKAYLSHFDATEPQKESKNISTGGAAQSALEHFGNAASLGYLPQISALTEPVTAKIFDAITGNNISQDMPSYVQRRDEVTARLKQQEKENPTASTLGSIGGGLSGGIALSSILPGAAAAKGAGQVIAQGAKTGAIIGAASNPGETEGDVSPLQLGDRAKNAAIGGALGGGIAATGEAIKKGGQVVGDYFKNRANINAVKAAGATKGDIKIMNKTAGGANAVGETLLEENAIPVFGTPGRIAKRLGSAIDKKEDAVSGLIKEAVDTIHDPKFISNATPEQLALIQKADIKPKEIASRLIQEFKDANPNIPEEKIAPAIKEVEVWLNKQPEIMPLDVAQKFKRSMNKFLKDSDYYREVGFGKQGTLAVQGGIREGIEQGTDAVADVLGKQGGKLKLENRSLGNLIQANKANTGKLAGDAARDTFSFSDKAAGVAGAALGGGPISGALLSAAAAGVNKFGRAFGDSIAARSENAIARALSKYSPEVARKISESPAAVAALVSQQLRQDEKQQEDNNLDPIQRRLVEIQNKGRSPAKGKK